jgi:protein-S-isoprenylcysteine O-methyltransferase Ste14
VSRLITTGVFALLAVLTLSAAVRDGAAAVSDPSLEAWLGFGYALLKVVIISAFTGAVATRDPARRPSRDPVAFVSCFAAIAAVIMLRPPDHGGAGLLIVGEAVALVATAWTVAAVLSLGRCFGVLPEARGLVTTGAYRFVRHPVYLGELGAYLGLTLAAPGLGNLLGAVVFVVAQHVRMGLEERALTEEFPDYREYAARTGRVLPRAAWGGPRPERQPA